MTLLQFLEHHGIPYRRFEHPAVFTCQQANDLLGHLPGMRTKNLFLRDRRGLRHFLVVLPDTRTIDLRALTTALGADRLSFASKERLQERLGIEPGAVSLLALVNDLDQQVELVIDPAVWRSESVQCHPLVNTETFVMMSADLQRFLESTGHEPVLLPEETA